MKLERIHIRDFKRFADLEISNIPEAAKLVLLTGPNGSGKTSLFEAFTYWMKLSAWKDWSYDPDYYLRAVPPSMKDGGWQKSGTGNLAQETWNKITPTFWGVQDDIRHHPETCKKAFYIRSAYRHSPDFSSQGVSRVDDVLNDASGARMLITSESRVHDNYQRLVSISLENLYDQSQRERTAGQITDELIGDVRAAMLRVFDGLEIGRASCRE